MSQYNASLASPMQQKPSNSRNGQISRYNSRIRILLQHLKPTTSGDVNFTCSRSYVNATCLKNRAHSASHSSANHSIGTQTLTISNCDKEQKEQKRQQQQIPHVESGSVLGGGIFHQNPRMDALDSSLRCGNQRRVNATLSDSSPQTMQRKANPSIATKYLDLEAVQYQNVMQSIQLPVHYVECLKETRRRKQKDAGHQQQNGNVASESGHPGESVTKTPSSTSSAETSSKTNVFTSQSKPLPDSANGIPSLDSLFQLFQYLYNSLSHITASRYITHYMLCHYHLSEWSLEMIQTVAQFYRDIEMPWCAVPYLNFAVFEWTDDKHSDSSSTPQRDASSKTENSHANSPTSLASRASFETSVSEMDQSASPPIPSETQQILKNQGLLVDLPSIDSLSKRQNLFLDLIKCLITSGLPFEVDQGSRRKEIVVDGVYNLNRLLRKLFPASSHLRYYLEGTLFFRIGDNTEALKYYKLAIRHYPQFPPYQHLFFNTAMQLDQITTIHPSLRYMRPKQLEGKNYLQLWNELEQELGLESLKSKSDRQRLLVGP